MSEIVEKLHKKETLISYFAMPGLKLDGVKYIIDTVCREFNVTKEDVIDKRSRKREFAFPRHIMMFIGQIVFEKYTLKKIGSKFGGYDHATVLHAKKAVLDIISYDKEMYKKFMIILDEINMCKTYFIQKTYKQKATV
tara:strand:+ start:9546 stop:9959 length:414 start_codon:yes stop_codon:yes gene_type:complete